MDREDDLRRSFQATHPRLDQTTPLSHQGFEKLDKKKGK